MRATIAYEYDECALFWDWTQTQPWRHCAFKIVNEGKRTNGKRLNRIGFRPGLPDYVILHKNPVYASLWLEIKRKSKSATSLAQKEIVALLRNLGHCAVVCYGGDEAIETTKKYFANELVI